jgi:hypothetical protein
VQRERQLRLIVQAVEALAGPIRGLLDRLGGLAGLRVDLERRLVATWALRFCDQQR